MSIIDHSPKRENSPLKRIRPPWVRILLSSRFRAITVGLTAFWVTIRFDHVFGFAILAVVHSLLCLLEPSTRSAGAGPAGDLVQLGGWLSRFRGRWRFE
jgi:hypothetical protein